MGCAKLGNSSLDLWLFVMTDPSESFPSSKISSLVTTVEHNGGYSDMVQIPKSSKSYQKVKVCWKHFQIFFDVINVWVSKFRSSMICVISYSSESIWVIKLFFCQNDPPIGESLWHSFNGQLHYCGLYPFWNRL